MDGRPDGYRCPMPDEERPVADTVVLDVDGTLVDSTYHHVRAWADAFVTVGRTIPEWRIHRAIGMGGDRLVTEVAGEPTERAAGEEVRKQHDALFDAMMDHLELLPGADGLISALKQRGYLVVAASSGTEEQTRTALEKLSDVRHLDGWISGNDVEETKPSADMLTRAVDKVRGHAGIVVGDSIWDMESAQRLGWYAVGLRSGGFATDELVKAGADIVLDDAADLVAHLDSLPGPGHYED